MRVPAYIVLVLVGVAIAAAPQTTAPEAQERSAQRISMDQRRVEQWRTQRVETLQQAAQPQVAPQSPAARPAKALSSVWDQKAYSAKVAEYEKLRADAAASGDKEQEAEAAIAKGRTIEAWSAVNVEQKGRYPEAFRAYQEAVDVGTMQQRGAPLNNIGVLRLRSGDKSGALEAFRNIDLQHSDPEQRRIYQFNYGRALEDDARFDDALAQYTAVVNLDASFRPAVDGAFRVLSHQPRPNPAVAVQVAQVLLKANQLQTLGPNLRSLLRAWVKAPDAAAVLLPVVVRYYSSAQIGEADFRENEWPVLASLPAECLAGTAAHEIKQAYVGSLTLPPSPYAVRQVFPTWSTKLDHQAFSMLLKMTGDLTARRPDPKGALVRYYAAWAMDQTNSDAMLYTIAILRDQPREVDPNGALLERMVRELFFEKGEAYSRDDQLAILRLHTLLGSIFERQAKWGPAGDPHSALFQYKHALDAEPPRFNLRGERPDTFLTRETQ